MKNFNPFLSQDCSSAVYHNILVWMKHCVLEDKLTRLLRLSQNCRIENMQKQAISSVELQILQELGAHRSWSAEEHPEWLAFEVIAQLQIRPIQYTVAQSLIDGVERKKEGPITQLNMGEGKTRVILPMLAMHWKKSDKLVRFNFLSALLHEAGEYLHNVLSASVIDIRVFHFPFNRDVHLTPENASTFLCSLQHCHKLGGVVLCTPEHRQSLRLKYFELQVDELLTNEMNAAHSESIAMDVESDAMDFEFKSIQTELEDETQLTDVSNEVCETLEEVNTIKFLDILDEVDEILRTRNKIIYAVGPQEHLPSKESR